MNEPLRKPRESDVFYAWFFMRHFSRPLVPLAAKLGLSPNSISAASILSGLVALVYLVRGTIADDLIGLLILQFSFLLDCLDGDLARAQRTGSYGESANIGGTFLDYSRELIIPPLVHLSLAVGLHRVSPALPLVYMAATASILKLAPQLAKGHLITAQLRHANGDYLNVLKTGPVLQDSLDSLKKGTGPISLLMRLVKSVFGFPGGLINSMTVIAVVGLFYGQDIYISGKTGLLWTATILYLVSFVFTYRKVFKQLQQVPPSQTG